MTIAYRWNCVSAEVTWSPRDGAQLVSFRDKLFLLGGWNQYAGERPDLAGVGAGSFESDVCSEVWCSDDGGGSWSLAATAPWSGRHMHGAVVHDDYIWIVGAENGTPDDVWKSKDGVNWGARRVNRTLAGARQPDGHCLRRLDLGHGWPGQRTRPDQLRGGLEGWETLSAGASTVARRLADTGRSELGAGDGQRAMGPQGYDHRREWRRACSDDRMWILGGGYVGTGGTTVSSLRYDLEQQPRLKTRLYHNDVWSSADGRE